MQRWIEFKDGRFGGVFQDESVLYNNFLVDKNTSDEDMFAVGVLRLEKVLPEFPDLPSIIVEGPIYELAHDGSAKVTERFTHLYPSIEEAREQKINAWFVEKDKVMREGIVYKGKKYDLRFRNISYLSLLATLIVNNEYPENFEWFDAEGEVAPLSKEDCIGLIKEAIHKVVQLETGAVEMLKKIKETTSVRELFDLEIVIDGE